MVVGGGPGGFGGAEVGDGFAVAIEAADPEGIELSQRAIFPSLDSEPTVRIVAPVPFIGPSLALATDGTHLVINDREDGVRFFLPDG